MATKKKKLWNLTEPFQTKNDQMILVFDILIVIWKNHRCVHQISFIIFKKQWVDAKSVTPKKELNKHILV